MFVEVVPPRRQMDSLARALDREANGQQFARDLSTNIHEALQPLVTTVQGAVLGMSTGGLPHGGQPLRTAVAQQVESYVRLSGKSPGAGVRVRKYGMPRGFNNAPRRLNARKGWRHPVFGNTNVWVHQVGEPGWFDDNTTRFAGRYRVAVKRAMDDMAERIARSG